VECGKFYLNIENADGHRKFHFVLEVCAISVTKYETSPWFSLPSIKNYSRKSKVWISNL